MACRLKIPAQQNSIVISVQGSSAFVTGVPYILDEMLYNPVSYTHLDVYKRQNKSWPRHRPLETYGETHQNSVRQSNNIRSVGFLT